MSQGVQIIYDLGQSNAPATLANERFKELGLQHSRRSSWPCDAEPLVGDNPSEHMIASHRMLNESIILYEFGDDPGAETYALALANIGDGSAACTAWSRLPARAESAVGMVKAIVGVNPQDDPGLIPMRFWAYGQHGPQFHRRELDAPRWGEIQGNYAASTLEGLTRLMVPTFRPDNSGQLILWSGPPGTGKTTAIRALAQCWRDFADFDYVTDPDKFFGEKADYMLQVMLGQEDETGHRWRVLILEDSGELIQPDAKQAQGQALSRFLNAVDGLIGQGLRVMTLLTTNEDFSQGHEAVTRHGRASAQIEFEKLSPEESMRWLGEHGVTGSTSHSTLADLYAEVEGHKHKREGRPVGFTG